MVVMGPQAALTIQNEPAPPRASAVVPGPAQAGTIGQAGIVQDKPGQDGSGRYGPADPGPIQDGLLRPAIRRGILARALELDIVPRLVQSRRRQEQAVTADHVAELVGLVLAPDGSAVPAFIAAMQARGVQAESLYLDLLTPSARLLGEFWVDDVSDFTEVTIGVGRLQHAARALAPAFHGHGRPGRKPVGRAVLLPLPGEQHSFGLQMVCDFFRRAGWTVRTAPSADRETLHASVSSAWVDVLGLSFACEEQADRARDEIREARRVARNPAMAVMVGGPPFVGDPGLIAGVGADGTATDARQAVLEAGALMRCAALRR